MAGRGATGKASRSPGGDVDLDVARAELLGREATTVRLDWVGALGAQEAAANDVRFDVDPRTQRHRTGAAAHRDGKIDPANRAATSARRQVHPVTFTVAEGEAMHAVVTG